MKILVLFIADGKYAEAANRIIKEFQANITNPEEHEIFYIIEEPNHDFDYLSFMNEWHSGTKISLGRFKYFNDLGFDRVIYLDADTQIVGNLDLLISKELNSKPYWACHVHQFEKYYGEQMIARKVTNDMIINGGLQIINKQLLTRKFNRVLVDNLRVGESFDGSDQGYISELFPKLGVDIGWLDDKYNYCLQDPYRPECSDVRINHYTGAKLWEM